MSYNFILADITGNVNNDYLYDERDQGKRADAACSLRLRYHLRKMKQYGEAGITPLWNMTKNIPTIPKSVRSKTCILVQNDELLGFDINI